MDRQGRKRQKGTEKKRASLCESEWKDIWTDKRQTDRWSYLQYPENRENLIKSIKNNMAMQTKVCEVLSGI